MYILKKSVLCSAVIATLVGFGSLAEAATISLSPGHQVKMPGDTVSVDLSFNFTGGKAVLGGGVDVSYDSSVLDFTLFTYEPTFKANNPDFQRIPDDQLNKVNGITFGNFGGLSGEEKVGTLTFKAIQVGETWLTMTDNVFPAGGFFDVAGDKITIDYQPIQGAHVKVVPIPAAVWLFGSGLAWLGLFGSRRRARS